MRSKIAALAVLASTVPAWAHVSLAVPEAAAGTYYVGAFRVGHGCGAAATTALRITLPDGIAGARPQPKPGWTLAIEHGEAGVSAIVWKGGPLPADEFDSFAILMKLPDKPGILLFPAVQTCTSGTEEWTEAPMAGMRMPHPAPVLTVTPAAGAPDDGMGGMHHAM